MLMRATLLVSATSVRLQSSSSNNGAPETQSKRPLLSISKPSFIVKTESNVRKERREKPDPPCVVCRGSGRVDCYNCQGRGRTNHTDLVMLPRGEWPKWCRACGGSGLSHCSRCLGTGEYRYRMGFHFMKRDTEDTQDTAKHKSRDQRGTRTADDFLFNNEDAPP
ncbi:hypothetical protein LIER_01293 [Lithospermum erythrorhizon]|uniref:Uncharacterized protein n=1 Tax=Lithospermum erythrorhizon TaxID=34254 RepID=A0AAV3NKD2_LITER